jgi:hypothetical protein
MVFDGSDVGLKYDINGFAVLDDGSMLLSFHRRVNRLGDLRSVQGQDIVRFVPSATGQNTAGRFEWFFDGSDVGMQGGKETLQSIAFAPDGRLVISTKGNAVVPGPGGSNLQTRPSDLLVFNANQFGNGTSGTFEMYFNGSDVGMGDNTITGTWIDEANGDIYLSTQKAQSAGGVTYDSNDVFICSPISLGTNTACNFSGYWRGEDHGFGARGITAIELGTGLDFVRPTGTITIVKEVTSGSGSFGFTGDLGNFSLTVTSGNASEQFSNLDTGTYSVRESVPPGWQLTDLQCDDPDNGTAIASSVQAIIDLDAGENVICTFVNTPDGAAPSEDDVYISPTRNGKLDDGTAVTDGDIMVFRANGDQDLFFDGSTFGISKLEAFAILEDNTILMSFGRRMNMPGTGWVEPQDIVRFRPTFPSSNANGSFEMYFDGSDVGLWQTRESIDAIAIDGAGRLILSTSGNVDVLPAGAAQIVARNHDLLAFEPTSLGDSTSGDWSLLLDGSDVGLNGKNVTAVWLDNLNGDIYLSLSGSKTLPGGLRVTNNTVFVCTPSSLGDTSACSYQAYFDAADFGFRSGVDGVHVVR